LIPVSSATIFFSGFLIEGHVSSLCVPLRVAYQRCVTDVYEELRACDSVQFIIFQLCWTWSIVGRMFHTTGSTCYSSM